MSPRVSRRLFLVLAILTVSIVARFTEKSRPPAAPEPPDIETSNIFRYFTGTVAQVDAVRRTLTFMWWDPKLHNGTRTSCTVTVATDAVLNIDGRTGQLGDVVIGREAGIVVRQEMAKKDLLIATSVRQPPQK